MIDASGVALAAIQGLYQLSQEQAAHIARLEAERAALQEQVEAQQQRMDELEARLATLERGGTPGIHQSEVLPGIGMTILGLAVVLVAQRKGGGR